ncbi:MAG TPA: R3H domain-containing nucleic acid-binding protein [Candidatus Saccharimonadales bacterium]|jgi:spoIIIJ-associated protein|nr:R3H domain-containing nucleic acid-binding protein [Candidatus Saccharimonadales bacterium]
MDTQQSVDFAKKYLEDMISFFGVNVEVVASLSEDVIELAVPTTELNSVLIGRNAETLRSMQYLISTTLRNKGANVARVNVDIADYKKLRAEKVAADARVWIEGVRKSGDSYVAHLNAADRRIVHRVADEYDDIRTFSEGEGAERSIIIAQKSS